jgi:hypothetical protein
MQKNVGRWEESRASMLVTPRSEAMLCYAYLDNYFMSGAADALTARNAKPRYGPHGSRTSCHLSDLSRSEWPKLGLNGLK